MVLLVLKILVIYGGQHYQTLLISSSESLHKEGVINNCTSIVFSQDMHVTVEEVCSAFKCSNSVKYIMVLLPLLFTMIFMHGYLTKKFMLGSIDSLVKIKGGDITSKDNYRPVAVKPVISKLIAIIILNRYTHFL